MLESGAKKARFICSYDWSLPDDYGPTKKDKIKSRNNLNKSMQTTVPRTLD